jgi:hypothetical protein
MKYKKQGAHAAAADSGSAPRTAFFHRRNKAHLECRAANAISKWMLSGRRVRYTELFRIPIA